MTSPAIRLENVTQTFANGYTALKDVGVEIRPGRFVSMVGPSGCGKSTLLNIIAGLSFPSSGRVEVFGEPLEGINRRATYMFQRDGLLPWKTVHGNIALGLTFRNREDDALTADWIRRVGLDGFATSYPHQLSGGMRKRVALAQAWITNPDMVLMDEPFSALDVHTRLRMETELLNLWTGSGRTVVFVTHDLEEAIALSDEVIVLAAGPASRAIHRYEIPLSRPRNLIDIRTEPEFTRIYGEIWSALREEVLKSYARTG